MVWRPDRTGSHIRVPRAGHPVVFAGGTGFPVRRDLPLNGLPAARTGPADPRDVHPDHCRRLEPGRDLFGQYLRAGRGLCGAGDVDEPRGRGTAGGAADQRAVRAGDRHDDRRHGGLCRRTPHPGDIGCDDPAARSRRDADPRGRYFRHARCLRVCRTWQPVWHPRADADLSDGGRGMCLHHAVHQAWVLDPHGWLQPRGHPVLGHQCEPRSGLGLRAVGGAFWPCRAF